MGEGSEFGDWKAVKGFKEVLAFFFQRPKAMSHRDITHPDSNPIYPKAQNILIHILFHVRVFFLIN